MSHDFEIHKEAITLFRVIIYARTQLFLLFEATFGDIFEQLFHNF